MKLASDWQEVKEVVAGDGRVARAGFRPGTIAAVAAAAQDGGAVLYACDVTFPDGTRGRMGVWREDDEAIPRVGDAVLVPVREG